MLIFLVGEDVFTIVVLAFVLPSLVGWAWRRWIENGWLNDKARKEQAEIYRKKERLIQNPPKTEKEKEDLRQWVQKWVLQHQSNKNVFIQNYQGSKSRIWKKGLFTSVIAEFDDAIAACSQALAYLESLHFEHQSEIIHLRIIAGRVELIKDGGRVVEFRFSGLQPDTYTFTVRGKSRTLEVNEDINLHHTLFGLPPLTSSQISITSSKGEQDSADW